MPINKNDVQRPVRRAETIHVEALAGEVIVRQVTLGPYLVCVRRGVGGQLPMAAMLADCVVDANAEPIFSEAEWELWAPRNMAATWQIYEKVRELSNLDADTTEKN